MSDHDFAVSPAGATRSALAHLLARAPNPCALAPLPAALADFSPWQAALSITLHPSVPALLASFYHPPLVAYFRGLALELLLVADEQDVERLKENLLGHVLMQQQLKRPISLFIASTRHNDGLVALDNRTGAVVFEWLESGRQVTLAPDAAQFLAQLTF
ncbi:MAG: SecY-interacting protein Syd [Aeromonas sp.]